MWKASTDYPAWEAPSCCTPLALESCNASPAAVGLPRKEGREHWCLWCSAVQHSLCWREAQLQPSSPPSNIPAAVPPIISILHPCTTDFLSCSKELHQRKFTSETAAKRFFWVLTCPWLWFSFLMLRSDHFLLLGILCKAPAEAGCRADCWSSGPNLEKALVKKHFQNTAVAFHAKTKRNDPVFWPLTGEPGTWQINPHHMQL